MKSLFPVPLIKIPNEAKTIQIGQKRSRGRPCMAKKQYERNDNLKAYSKELDDEEATQ